MCYFLVSWEKGAFLFYPTEAVVQRCSVKKVFLEISQNSQENTWARDYFLIKLQASGFAWIRFFLIVEVSILHVLYPFHEIKLNVMKYTLNCVHEIVWKKYFSVSSPLWILLYKYFSSWEILRNFSIIFRSSHQRCSIKKAILKRFVIFTGKHLCRGLFFLKVAGHQSCNFIKKRLQCRYYLADIRNL